MLACSSIWKSPKHSYAALVNSVNSCAFCLFAVANAYAVLARSCNLKSLRRGFSILAKPASNYASDLLAIAKTHTVLVMFCALKSPRPLACAANSCASCCWVAVTNAHAVL